MNELLRNRNKSILLKVFLIIVPALMLLIAAEAGLRIYFRLFHRDIAYHRPSFYYVHTMGDDQFNKKRFFEHPFLPYAPQERDSRVVTIYSPESNAYIHYDYTQNSLGFRTFERPFQKNSEVKRIITLGGSTTWDGPNNETTWPALLEKKLNQYYKRTGYEIEVINLAVDGAPSPSSLIILNLLGVAYSPDLVISYDGVNDFQFSFYEGILPDYRNAVRRFDSSVWSLQFSCPRWLLKSYLFSVFSSRFDRIQNRNVHVHGQMFKPLEQLSEKGNPLASIGLYERNLKLMRGISAEYGSRFIASIPHHLTVSRSLTMYDQHVRRFFEKEKIDYLDLQERLPHDDLSFHVDQVHWTVKGLNAAADEWFKKIVDEDYLNLKTG